MAKQEITLQGLDGQLDELILTTNDETANGKLEDCARMLFPQEGETTPRLRFKGFEGEWQKKLLSDCLEISDEKNTDNIFGIEDVLSVSDENGVVNQIEHLGRSYAGKSVSGYKILRPGQIVYTKSPLRAKPYGIVKHNTGKAGIVSVLYAVYNPKEGVAPEYIHYYFDPAWRLNAYMRPLVNKGAKNTMNISDETALTGYIMIPKDIEEQKRIASFLQRLDDQMKLHQHQFERLKQLKSACLDSMFPQQSENTPPIRFKNFNNKWNRAMASELFITYNNRNHPELPVLSACQDIRGMAVRSESGYDISHDRANEVTYKVVMPGQFVILFQWKEEFTSGDPVFIAAHHNGSGKSGQCIWKTGILCLVFDQVFCIFSSISCITDVHHKVGGQTLNRMMIENVLPGKPDKTVHGIWGAGRH